VIKGGYLDGASVDAAQIAKMADLESREVLLGKLAGAMLASLSQAVYLLNAPLAQAARLVGALEAKAEQDPSIPKGGAGEPVAAATAATEEPAAEEAPDTGAESTEAPAVAGTEDAASEDAPATEETTPEATPSTEA
jgi:large subunit ribosomal protein L10